MLLKYLNMNKFCREVGKSVHYLSPLSHLLRLFNTEGSDSGKEVPSGVSALLVCGDVSLDDWCPMFRDTGLVAYSRIKCPKKASAFEPSKLGHQHISKRRAPVSEAAATSNKMETSTVSLRKPKSSQISREG